MRVVMTHNITGYRNGEPWPAPGGSIDLPNHEARDLIAAGYAEPGARVARPAPRKAVAPKPAAKAVAPAPAEKAVAPKPARATKKA